MQEKMPPRPKARPAEKKMPPRPKARPKSMETPFAEMMVRRAMRDSETNPPTEESIMSGDAGRGYKDGGMVRSAGRAQVSGKGFRGSF